MCWVQNLNNDDDNENEIMITVSIMDRLNYICMSLYINVINLNLKKRNIWKAATN